MVQEADQKRMKADMLDQVRNVSFVEEEAMLNRRLTQLKQRQANGSKTDMLDQVRVANLVDMVNRQLTFLQDCRAEDVDSITTEEAETTEERAKRLLIYHLSESG